MKSIIIDFRCEESTDEIMLMLRKYLEENPSFINFANEKMQQFGYLSHENLRSWDGYKSCKDEIKKEFFWKQGDYTAEIIINYNKKLKKIYNFKFSLSEDDITQLEKNIDECIVASINITRNKSPFFNTVVKKGISIV